MGETLQRARDYCLHRRGRAQPPRAQHRSGARRTCERPPRCALPHCARSVRLCGRKRPQTRKIAVRGKTAQINAMCEFFAMQEAIALCHFRQERIDMAKSQLLLNGRKLAHCVNSVVTLGWLKNSPPSSKSPFSVRREISHGLYKRQVKKSGFLKYLCLRTKLMS